MTFFRIFSFSKKKPLRVNATAKSSGKFQGTDFIYNFLTLLYLYREKPRCTSTNSADPAEFFRQGLLVITRRLLRDAFALGVGEIG